MRRMQEISVFDKDVVAAVLDGDTARARGIAEEKIGMRNHFSPAKTELRVEWVKPGDEFEIVEDPICERIRMKRDIEFWRA